MGELQEKEVGYFMDNMTCTVHLNSVFENRYSECRLCFSCLLDFDDFSFSTIFVLKYGGVL
jgi:hypothetical protein